ncbi:MAG: ABC transporter ATP-binding protein, partial [Polyangia bacterium]
MTNGDAIAIRGVTKYFGDYAAVDDLTLSVPRGSVYGFIGPTGSGKTTTLRMVMNILFPDAGEIVVLGEKTTQAARDRVSYLPEERGLYKKMSVRELLRYYGRLKSVPRARLDGAIDAWLERMQLADRAGLRIESLSKGQAQKVQFIASVVSEPELLILDEPFSGLDPVNAESLKDAVLSLRDRGATIVFSTHDMSTAER